jgi:hypothetical protein
MKTANITIDLDFDIVLETMIALNDRKHSLMMEIQPERDAIVIEIIRRQLSRVEGAMAGLQDAIEGARLKGAAI